MKKIIILSSFLGSLIVNLACANCEGNRLISTNVLENLKILDKNYEDSSKIAISSVVKILRKHYNWQGKFRDLTDFEDFKNEIECKDLKLLYEELKNKSKQVLQDKEKEQVVINYFSSIDAALKSISGDSKGKQINEIANLQTQIADLQTQIKELKNDATWANIFKTLFYMLAIAFAFLLFCLKFKPEWVREILKQPKGNNDELQKKSNVPIQEKSQIEAQVEQLQEDKNKQQNEISEKNREIEKLNKKTLELNQETLELNQEISELRSQLRQLQNFINKEFSKDTIENHWQEDDTKKEQVTEKTLNETQKYSGFDPLTTKLFYLSVPIVENGKTYFRDSRIYNFSPVNCIYEFTVDSNNPSRASFSLVDGDVAVENAIQHFETYLDPACRYDSLMRNATKIITKEKDKGLAVKDGDRWRVEHKAKVEFR